MDCIARSVLILAMSVGALVGMAHAQPSTEPSDSSTFYHKVLPGDTLWGISETYFGESSSWPLLQDINAVDEPRHLQPGQMIDLGEVDPFPVTVAHLSGEAWLIRETEAVPLTRGQSIQNGDTLETGSNAFVTLMMNDASRVVLPSKSRVTLASDDENGLSVQLLEGEVESLVPKRRLPRQRFEVTTPLGVIGVRGTHFRVNHTPSRSLGSVLEGRINSSTHGPAPPRLVDAGQGVRIDSQGGQNVVELLEAPQRLDIVSQRKDLLLELAPVDGAASYRVQLSQDPGFLTIGREAYMADGELRLVDVEEGFYHVRASALDEQGLEGRYLTRIIYHRPTQVMARELDGDSWSFDWASSPDVQYRLQLSADPAHRHELVAVETDKSGPVRLNRLPAGTLYWKLESWSEDEAVEPTRLLDSGSVNVDPR